MESISGGKRKRRQPQRRGAARPEDGPDEDEEEEEEEAMDAQQLMDAVDQQLAILDAPRDAQGELLEEVTDSSSSSGEDSDDRDEDAAKDAVAAAAPIVEEEAVAAAPGLPAAAFYEGIPGPEPEELVEDEPEEVPEDVTLKLPGLGRINFFGAEGVFVAHCGRKSHKDACRLRTDARSGIRPSRRCPSS